MLDVVPPSPGETPRRSSETESLGRPQKKHKASTNEPVTFEWKPPARLRRPIHDELQRQRQQRRQHKAIVEFTRRPLVTKVGGQTKKRRHARAKSTLQGAEQHTGDVYRSTTPRAHLGMPPYAGGYVRGRAPVGPPPGAIQMPPTQAVAPRPEDVAPKQAQPKLSKQPVAKQVPITGERDIPFTWDEAADTAEVAPSEQEPLFVQAPAKRFALPLHFSIFPGKKAQQGTAQEPSTGKKKRFRTKLNSPF